MTAMHTPTRADQLCNDIANAIVSGKFEPGTRLDEQTLAIHYGVSRTPVREALRKLATSGLIEIRPRRGAVVTTITLEGLSTLFGALAEGQATCARLSALRMTPIERRRLGALHEQMGQIVERGDNETYTAANQTFHDHICAGAHNAVIADFAAGLRKRLGPFNRTQFHAPGRLAQSYAEHDAIVRAILGARAADAHAAMLHHLSLVVDAYEQLVTTGLLAPDERP